VSGVLCMCNEATEWMFDGTAEVPLEMGLSLLYIFISMNYVTESTSWIVWTVSLSLFLHMGTVIINILII